MWKGGAQVAIIVVLLAVGSFELTAGPANEKPKEPTTVIVVRHAEKEEQKEEQKGRPSKPDNEVPLTKAGHIRAATLAQVLEGAGVTKIYVTEKLRTRQTAQPLTSPAVPLNEIAKAEVDRLINEVVDDANRGHVIVIVGHSDTVPAIVAKLGGGTVTVGEKEFDNLFVLTLHAPNSTRLIRATYGEPRTCPSCPR